VSAAAPEPAVLVLAPSRGLRPLELAELWRCRELLYVLAWRDLKVRYRQTLLGVLWVTLQPALNMALYTFLFNRLARFEASGGVPYAVFVLLGLLPWGFFVAGVQGAGNSLLGSAHLISKVYFPRLLVPTAAVLVALVDLLVAGLLVVALMGYYGLPPAPSLLWLPLVVLVAVALAAGLGFWLSALNVEYRDVRVLTPFLLQLGMYLTPVVYPLHVLPERVRRLVTLNPMTGVVEAFRACLLGGPLPWAMLSWSAAASALLLLGGALYFRRMERVFADVI